MHCFYNEFQVSNFEPIIHNTTERMHEYNYVLLGQYPVQLMQQTNAATS